MNMLSRIISSQINWDKAGAEQKLAALAELPPKDPLFEQLAMGDSDAGVRHKAIERMELEAQLRLVGAVRSEDENCLASCLGERLDDSVVATDDVVSQLKLAPSAFRIAVIGCAKSEMLAIGLTKTLEHDSDRALVARGKGVMDARAAAVTDMHDTELLEAIAHEYRDKQRRIYRAARDRADQLLAAREVRRRALELCERLTGLLERHELTLTAVTNAEREWVALALPSMPDAAEMAPLQTRYAALKEQARDLLQEQSESWRDSERLKAVFADLAARSEADEAVEPESFALLVAEREAAAKRLSQAVFAPQSKDRNHLLETLGTLTERHAILAVESKALANARKLVNDLRVDPAALSPAWRADFARSIAIVRPALRVSIEEAGTAACAAIDAATRQQIEAQRLIEQQHVAGIDALVRQLEQLLDKGQHRQANEIAIALKSKHAEVPGARRLPAALEFRLKRCQDRLAKMNELKRFGEMQAREALCREAEALVKRVAQQEKFLRAKHEPADFPWPVSPNDLSPRAIPGSSAGVTALPGSPPALSPENSPIASGTLHTSPEPVEASIPGDTHGTDTRHSTEYPESAAPDESKPVTNVASAAMQSGAGRTSLAPDTSAPEPLAPDALALAVRELQARWQALDKSQGSSSKGLWERFRRACDRAYAPAKKHFEELEKQRSENARRKKAVLDKLAGLNERIVAGAHWNNLLNERGELIKAWFEAGVLPRKNALAMQKQFDALTADIDSRFDTHRSAERTRRRSLIDQARLISERAADGGSIAAMIALQKQWQEGMKGAIRLKAREDQSMWEEFRACGTALFGKREAEKAARSTERDAQLTTRRVLTDEMQSLVAGSDSAAIRRGIDEISERWHAMAWPERKPLREWEQRFSSARAAASDRITTIRVEAENRKQAAAAARLAVVECAEQALGNGIIPDMGAVRSELQSMLAEGEKPDSRVVARLASLEAAVAMGPDAWRAQAQKSQTERDALLLELEIVLGLPSPQELEGERRMRMLKRLAESKNSRSTPPLMAPDASKAVEKLLALPLAMQGVQSRVEAVIEATRRKAR